MSIRIGNALVRIVFPAWSTFREQKWVNSRECRGTRDEGRGDAARGEQRHDLVLSRVGQHLGVDPMTAVRAPLA